MMSIYQIPSNLNQILTVSKYEFLRYLRGKKILGMVAITIAISALFIGLLEFINSQSPNKIPFDLASPISFVFFLIVIIAAFLGSGNIVSEFNKKTGQVLFLNPISRSSIWLGKFTASLVIAFSIISLYYIILVSYAAATSLVPVQIVLSLLFSFLSATMIMSIAFLTSTIFRGQTGAAVLIFALFIIAFPIVDNFMTIMSAEKPWFSPTFSSGIIKHILTVPYPSDQNTMGIPFFAGASIPKIADSLAVMTAYIVSASVLSIFIFKKRET